MHLVSLGKAFLLPRVFVVGRYWLILKVSQQCSCLPVHLNSNICLVFLILIIVPLPSSLTQEDSHNSESMIYFVGKKLVLEQGIFVYGGHNWKETIKHHFIAETSKVFLVNLWPRRSWQQVFLPSLYSFLLPLILWHFLQPCPHFAYIWTFLMRWQKLSFWKRPLMFLLLGFMKQFSSFLSLIVIMNRCQSHSYEFTEVKSN